ncbi:hypothetical protein SDC9_111759 [bioreactor metagenome]|uniref:Uncharacterized protein n=1 Tax=bioreactor metagenome TaxID=1076179 RepID=A0A645BIG0_9ZZZZ
MKKKLPVGSRISRLPNGHVLMEIRLKSLPKEMKFLSWASGFLKSRTELSEDMTKILKFELFHGDYLVQRKVYAYNDKVALRNFHHNDVVGSSPESIECEYIMLDSKGLPVLHHTKEFFYRNQIYYHFDD